MWNSLPAAEEAVLCDYGSCRAMMTGLESQGAYPLVRSPPTGNIIHSLSWLVINYIDI
jgi:hypothetical protein